MSPALKYWDGSAWQTLVGAQGLPGAMGEIAVAPFGTITAVAAPGALVADFGTIAFDGQPVVFEIAAGFIDLKTSTNVQLSLYDFQTGSDVLVTRMGYWREGPTTDSGGQWFPVNVAMRYTPSPGNHRYRIRLEAAGGAAAVLNQLDSNPNFARIVKAAQAPAVGAPHYAGISPLIMVGDAVGASGLYSSGFAPFVITKDAAGAVPLQAVLTPTLDCWVEADVTYLVRNTAAAWGRHEWVIDLMNYPVTAAKPDALGNQKFSISTMHSSGASDWIMAYGKAMWALAAGQTYCTRVVANWCSGGSSWNFFRDAQNLQFRVLGARPRY